MQCVYVGKVGKPPKPYDAYTSIELLALLHYTFPNDTDDDEESETTIQKTGKFGPPDLVGEKVRYEKPHKTGDPIVDAWEEKIARGEDPEW